MLIYNCSINLFVNSATCKFFSIASVCSMASEFGNSNQKIYLTQKQSRNMEKFEVDPNESCFCSYISICKYANASDSFGAKRKCTRNATQNIPEYRIYYDYELCPTAYLHDFRNPENLIFTVSPSS